MAIQKSITQNTGAVATYHKAMDGSFSINTKQLSIQVNSYLDSAHTDIQGFSPLSSSVVDVSFVLPMTATTPPAGATVDAVVQSIVEGALVAQPSGAFTGGTIVA